MTSDEIRKKFIDFFKSSPRNHQEISPAPLVLENDPSTLFTSSGMQPLVPYLMGEPHPEGKRLVNSQPCIRLQDIDEVGDNRHTTFFEMLGNWSLGDYFKEKQLSWFFEFLTDEKEGLGLNPKRLYVSVFEGTKDIPKDDESAKIWKGLGVPKDRIFYYGVDKNWWSRSGTPDKMPEGEIGGPDSEVFFEFTQVEHDKKFGSKCHPNCDCGRFLEIGNSVFIQYKKKKDGSLEELPQKNVDFGGGLERVTAAIRDDRDVFNTDSFSKIIENIEKCSGEKYSGRVSSSEIKNSMRVIADHMKSAVFLVAGGVVPSNKGHGYILRRLLRRAMVKLQGLKGSVTSVADDVSYNLIVKSVIDTYCKYPYLDIRAKEAEIQKTVKDERDKFGITLDQGLKLVGKISSFDLYQTYGFPPEITSELLQRKGLKFNKEEFDRDFKKHQELSRTASAGMFKGGLADHSEEVTKLHTATHLLHAALRKVLGEHVEQKGSNITKDRLRFDFSHPGKLTNEEVDKVEKLINEQIEKDLPVTSETMTQEQAKKQGALGFFGDRYAEKVKVYTIGKPDKWFSKEICGGPHITHTDVIGRVRIKKQEKIGAGLARIYVELA